MKKIHEIYYDICESTNDVAWSIEKNKRPALIYSDIQTKGRGRMGRSWISGEGIQIFASLVLDPKIDHEFLQWAPILSGIEAVTAIYNCLRHDFSQKKTHLSLMKLKWPNDIYFEGKKLGGILCETKFQGNLLLGIVIGIGINLTNAPNLADRKTISLRDIVSVESDCNWNKNYSLEITRMRILRPWAQKLNKRFSEYKLDMSIIRNEWEYWGDRWNDTLPD